LDHSGIAAQDVDPALGTPKFIFADVTGNFKVRVCI